MTRPITLSILFLCVLLRCHLVQAADEKRQWIWGADQSSALPICLVRSFELSELPTEATLTGVADYCRAKVYLNGELLTSQAPYSGKFQQECRALLRKGENVLAICAIGVSGPSAVFCRLDLQFADGTNQRIVTDSAWKQFMLHGVSLNWERVPEDTEAAITYGGLAKSPWGAEVDSLTVSPTEDYTQWKRAQNTSDATGVAMFDVPDGYELTLLRSAQPEEGSWVSMAFDSRGRVIIAKEKKGLLRLTLGEAGPQQNVEVINDTLQECRGLLFAHGGIYAMANNDKGLYLLRDSNGDDTFDDVRLLKQIDGDVGHGRNELTVAADGTLYAIFGDAVFEPEGATALPPALSDPTPAERTRSGYLAQFSPDGSQWIVIARGLRNPYGVAVNRHGDFFTYDADAEYDMGAPWYRPTRINHLVPGADFGWRRVTRQWPPYDPDRPDMPQPTIDIGKGSPTSVAFGYGSNFPSPYDNALFSLDWAYGRILAVHLSPWGSSYAAHAETFLQGRPANVTDIEFGPDGAMYFVTGGRGTQAALYRLRYTGHDSQDIAEPRQAHARRKHAEQARQRRKQLEALHGQSSSQILDTVWDDLNDDDPWIRHAARVVIEQQPIKTWQERVLKEERPTAALQGLLALVRRGGPSVYKACLQQLLTLDFPSLSNEQLATAIWLIDRSLESGNISSQARLSLQSKLDVLFPSASDDLNLPLSLLLAKMNTPDLVSRIVPLLLNATDQKMHLHYLFVLRNQKQGWSPDLRTQYFGQFGRSQSYVAGDGMATFLRLIQEEALANVPESDQEMFSKMLEQQNDDSLIESILSQKRYFVKEWSAEELSLKAEEVRSGRDFSNGKAMFAAARCVLCHHLGGEGGRIGPDLSAVASRFSPEDVLTSILDPSKVVAEKYRTHQFQLASGQVVSGQIFPGGDYRSPTLKVATDPLDPRKIVEISKQEIEHSQAAKLSPMPKGLLNTLSREEILDLLAYLDAGGNANHPNFK